MARQTEKWQEGGGSEAFVLPINSLFRYRVQSVDQPPSLGDGQGDVGHHDRLIGLSGSSTDEFLAKLVGQPIRLSLIKEEAVGR